MRLRNLLVTTAAVVAAGALALGPAAQASNPAAPSGCAGLWSNGYALTMNSIRFTLASPNGLISVS